MPIIVARPPAGCVHCTDGGNGLSKKRAQSTSSTTAPGYNPNDYSTSEVETRRDRALTDRFEPGSTMKIFTLAAALAGRSLAPTQTIYCEEGTMAIDAGTAWQQPSQETIRAYFAAMEPYWYPLATSDELLTSK